MDCAKAAEQLELFVLGELEPAERDAIEAHVATCAACEAAVREYRLLTNEIRQAGQPQPLRSAFVQQVRASAAGEIRSAARRARMRRALFVAGPIAAALMLGVLVWQVSLTQPGKGPDVSGKGPAARSSSGGLVQPAGQSPLSEIWHSGGARAAPRAVGDATVVRGQNIYVLQEDGPIAHVAALDGRTGEAKWLSEIQSIGHIAADVDRIYCLAPAASGQVDLATLDATSGRLLWRYRQDHLGHLKNPHPAVALAGGRVGWSTNTTCHLLRASDGQRLWSRSVAGEGLLSAAAALGDNLFVATGRGLYCLAGASGEVLWRLELGSEVSRTYRPLIHAAGGRIYAALRLRTGRTQTSRVICLEPDSRQIVWSRPMPHVFHLLAAAGRLYVRNLASSGEKARQGVAALDARTGEVLWDRPAKGCSPITYADGVVYFVDISDDGGLIALDARTGRKAWGMNGVQSCDRFIPASGTAYLKTRDGILHAMALPGSS